MMLRTGAVALPLLIALVATAQDRYGRPDPFDASVRTLNGAVRLPKAGARNPSLLALIEMKDPELRPLFQSLVQQPDRPVMQADAIVGLGMIDARGTVDPFILRQVQSDDLRSEVIKSLIGRDLLKAPEINQMLLWDDLLRPEDRLFLVATLQRQKQPWQPGALDLVMESERDEFRALAALLLLEQGKPEAWQNFRTVLSKMTPADRNVLLELLAPAVRTYRLTAAVDPLLRLASDREIDPNVRAAMVGSALELDPAAGLAALRDELSQDRSTINQLRYALLLLVVSELPGVPPDAFDAFDASTAPREVLAFAAAGRCARCGPGCAEAFTRVIDMGLRPAAEWSVTRAAACEDPATAAAVMNFVLDLSVQAQDPREPILILAVNAARHLIRISPDDLARRVLDPSVSTPVLESIMLALVDSASEGAARLASQIRGKLPRRFDSMAVVAMARGGMQLSKPDVELLGLIASGGGRVDEPIQVQAAWLYMKQLSRQRDALARLTLE